MNYLTFNDISYAQGNYDMAADLNPMVVMKMSGGDGVSTPLYFDTQANRNYANAKTAAKVPFMYHFYGGGDPVTEADWFLKAVSPLDPGDGLAVDIERATSWNPQTDPNAVSKVLAFAQYIHNQTGMWPWVYMNISTANMYDWSPVFKNCAFWCAAPSFGFDAALPVRYPVMAQQGPIVDGHDTNAAFMSSDELKLYTYRNVPAQPMAIAPAPTVIEPAPVEVPAPPAPVTPPTPVSAPVINDPLPPTLPPKADVFTVGPQVSKGDFMRILSTVAAFLKLHVPYLLGIAVVVVNALLANGDIHMSASVMGLVNSVLLGAGIGILHKRQS